MNLKEKIIRIKEDRVSGSTAITENACELMAQALSSGMSREELRGELMEILNAHRPMALLHNCIRDFLRGGDPEEFMEGVRKRTERAARNAAHHLRGMERVLTISSSSAVEMALSSFEGTVFAMESRPMLEGVLMAERLSKSGRDVYVVTDAYGISMVARGEVDAVVVGADSLYRDCIINKVGTYALSVACEKSGAEFMAVLTSDKMFPEDVELSDEEIAQYHGPEEITDRVRAMNPYFEAVPIRKGMRIFTESGELTI